MVKSVLVSLNWGALSDITESGFPLHEINLCKQLNNCVAVKSLIHSKCMALTDIHTWK